MSETAWDTPSCREWAEGVRSRLARPAALGVESSSRGARAGLWFLDRVSGTEETFSSRRFETVVEEVPGRIISGMAHCTKPFHLWNVLRNEFSGKLAFEDGPSWKVGVAVAEASPGPEGRPGNVVPVSRLVSRETEERSLAWAEAFGHARRLRNVLEQDPADEGLGLPD
jgi:hypothetical protein